MSEKYIDMMSARIGNAPYGTAFVVSDFTDIMDHETAKKSIARLEKNSSIRRVLRGVYDKPKYSTLLQEYAAPDPDCIAIAIARNNNWSISPSGVLALNLLGLSTQVPATWEYYSSGPYKSYQMDNCEIKFVHRANREIEGFSPKTSLIIQAIKAIGADGMSDTVISKLSGKLSDEEKETALDEGRQTTRWIYESLKKICAANAAAAHGGESHVQNRIVAR